MGEGLNEGGRTGGREGEREGEGEVITFVSTVFLSFLSSCLLQLRIHNRYLQKNHVTIT